MSNTPPLILGSVAFNSVLGVTDRILQIIHCAVTASRKTGEKGFMTDNIRSVAITFAILPTAVHIFMILIYCIFHTEEMLTPMVKLNNFIRYVISSELLYPIGVHKSFRTKYSENADNPLVTMKLLSAVHVMLVSIPQLLIVSINSSARDNFIGVDVASLIFSCLFIVWSVGYYFLCVVRDGEYDDFVTYYTYKQEKTE